MSRKNTREIQVPFAAACLFFVGFTATVSAQVGREVAVPVHLEDGDEYVVAVRELVDHGALLFDANWTSQEGAGRPRTKGNGNPLADPGSPLVFPRDFNRVSAPDANSCRGCHNKPRGGGGGDIVANVFVLGQRFDFATFDNSDVTPTRGGVNELGIPVEMQNIANSRNTLGMFGSGYIELLAREITTDLQSLRDGLAPGGSVALTSKGLDHGTLSRLADGTWVTTAVKGLPASSLSSAGPASPPSLIIRPFHQAGAVVSIREFSNNAFNHHHGIQITERFGLGDPDGDGFASEMTRADVTAAAVYQAQLAVPGRVIPRNPQIEDAILLGERRFDEIGCGGCHVSSLPLKRAVFVEPNPFNPPGNLRPGDAPDFAIDLEHKAFDPPRLAPEKDGVVHVPAYTDLKLHDITTGPGDPNREALDMLQPAGSPAFFAGNSRFLTRKLWGVANEPPYFHHGQYTTLRTAIGAHHGEAESSYQKWVALPSAEQDAIIEFLKSLQILPAGTKHLVVDEKFHPRQWPPRPGKASSSSL